MAHHRHSTVALRIVHVSGQSVLRRARFDCGVATKTVWGRGVDNSQCRLLHDQPSDQGERTRVGSSINPSNVSAQTAKSCSPLDQDVRDISGSGPAGHIDPTMGVDVPTATVGDQVLAAANRALAAREGHRPALNSTSSSLSPLYGWGSSSLTRLLVRLTEWPDIA
jgi:hypothetical protein